jgi:hypothetical protein
MSERQEFLNKRQIKSYNFYQRKTIQENPYYYVFNFFCGIRILITSYLQNEHKAQTRIKKNNLKIPFL